MKFSLCRIGLKLFAATLLITLFAGGCAQSNVGGSINKIELPDQKSSVFNTFETRSLAVNVVMVDEARDASLLDQVLSGVNDIYQQCQIDVTFDTQYTELSAERPINESTRSILAQQYKNTSPTIFFVPHNAEADVAFAYLPTHNFPTASTAWITNRVKDACLAWITAHELGHVLLNSGQHSNGTRNVMSNGCKQNNWGDTTAPTWTAQQCATLHQSSFLEMHQIEK